MFPRLSAILLASLAAVLAASAAPPMPTPSPHTVEIGPRDFLVDGKPLQIRCGEIHFARVPREYWRHRLKLCRAMGLNAVCAYLFWNFHEARPGTVVWDGDRDVAEFCRIAQEEGLWVILRPGPYACAEWEMGGLPWWLLRTPGVKLRSRDPSFMDPGRRWLKEVGRVLAPLQAARGGPILLVQVENEYGFHGNDAAYMGDLRQALADGGFTGPFFACNPPPKLPNGRRDDLFNVVNFGTDPEGAFTQLRAVQPTGPLMCGEFYPGWFDTWGQPHHRGDLGKYLADLETMLTQGASFSLYMAHGGTTFGFWAGADRPFKPDTTSYDYDAPISEAGWTGEKYARTRELLKRHLAPGEVLPEPPAPQSVAEVQAFRATERAALLDHLPRGIKDAQPRTMEAYDQPHGAILYRTELPAGPAGTLQAAAVHDFAWVMIDGSPIGVLDRRHQTREIKVPARSRKARLDLLVYAMGRVNFGPDIADRKGLHAPVSFQTPEGPARELKGWRVFPLDLGPKMLSSLRWKPEAKGPAKPGPRAVRADPAFWRARFTMDRPADTFLDVSTWGKGVVWINGRCLGRFWNIGPTQTLYVPGPWIRRGENEVVVLDFLGPTAPVLAGRTQPVPDQLRPELDFSRPRGYGAFSPESVTYLHESEFAPGPAPQDFAFDRTVLARQLCLESLDAHDGKPFAAAAELDLLDEQGRTLPHSGWTVVFVDSEEQTKEDGSALNAINGQIADHWHTGWSQRQPDHPHRLVIDLGAPASIAGFRYTPRQGDNRATGRIKKFRVYLGDKLAERVAPAK